MPKLSKDKETVPRGMSAKTWTAKHHKKIIDKMGELATSVLV
jgi:hypothetical protein